MDQKLVEAIAAVGEIVKADPRCIAVREAVDAYERSEDLAALIAEYNTQQNILADTYKSKDADMRNAVQARIDELYNTIIAHPVYAAYTAAKEKFDLFTNDIYGELQFAITGQRPCSHNCASCHSDCSSK